MPAIFGIDADLLDGMSHLSAGQSLSRRARLIEVIEDRNTPMHLHSLLNALLLGWDRDRGGYPPDAIDPQRLTDLDPHVPGPTVPVGAFARRRTTTAVGDLIFEVLACFGRAPLSDPWDLDTPPPDVPAELVDADRDTTPHPVQLVIDPFAIPTLTGSALDATRLRRLRTRGRWLTRLGHIEHLVEPPTDERSDATDRYLDWLIEHHRPRLHRWATDIGRGCSDDGGLRQLLRAGLDTIEQLLTSTDRIVRTGQVYWTYRALRRSLDDPDELLGRNRIETLGRIICSSYGQPLRYTALGWELERLAAEHGQGPMLVGAAYQRAIFTATHLLRDLIADQQPDGVLRRDGERLHVRLDHPTQWGGLWRTERVDPSSAPPWYVSYPVHLALEIGAGHPGPPATSTTRSDMTVTSDERQHRPDPPIVEQLVAAPLRRRDLTWRFAVKTTDLIGGTLAVPPEAARALPDGPCTVLLLHEADPGGSTQLYTANWTVETRPGAQQFAGIGWPAWLPIGTVLQAQLTRGTAEISLRSHRLATPVDGVDHEHDPALRAAAIAAVHAQPTDHTS